MSVVSHRLAGVVAHGVQQVLKKDEGDEGWGRGLCVEDGNRRMKERGRCALS